MIVSTPIKETPVTSQTPVKNVGDADYKKPISADEDIPIALYEGRFGKPYAAEFFGIKPNILSVLDAKTFDGLRDIDAFVSEQMAKAEMKDNKKSYNAVMNQLINLMGLSKDSNPAVVIEKVKQIIAVKNFFK